MKYLLTGGAGFIGSHFCEYLIENGHQVVVIDNFNDYYSPEIKRQNIASFQNNAQVEIIEGDILDGPLLDRIFTNNSFDAIVHLAARAGVRPSLSQPMLYQQVNIQGTMELLDRAKAAQTPKFVMASSSSVYGNNKKVPFSETDPVDNPISPYAATKKACELIGYTYHHLYKMNVTCLRFFTVYGPRQRPDMAIHKFTNLIAKGEPIPVYGDGMTRRDYTFISDIVDGIARSVQHCSGYHVYNLGESRTIELHALIKLIEESYGKTAVINRQPMQAGDVNCTYADISKARDEIGYAPEVDIHDGIPVFVDWYKKIHEH